LVIKGLGWRWLADRGRLRGGLVTLRL